MGSLVLGIESSCDETAVALVEDGARIRSNVVASQAARHERFGGVVPEVASRAHLEVFPGLVAAALAEAGVTFRDLSGVAATAAPGLIGSLLVGLSLGKSLAFRMGLPFAAVHHVEAHLYAARLEGEEPEFPALGLVVSGAHTDLYLLEAWGRGKRLAGTRDDAAGEAFDKAAKLLGLPYPGGPHLERLAAETRGDPGRFPPVRFKDGGADFSFSGYKTAVALAARRLAPGDAEGRRALAARFQASVVEEIRLRTAWFLGRIRPRTLIAGGGVLANAALRGALAREAERAGAALRIPPPELCADNAAMVAGLGARRLEFLTAPDWSVPAAASPKGDLLFDLR